jgi:hypothetical protein
VAESDFSDVIVVIVYLTTGRLASLKWMEIGFDGFVEIGGVQLFDIVLTIVVWFHFLLTSPFFSTQCKLDVLPDWTHDF